MQRKMVSHVVRSTSKPSTYMQPGKPTTLQAPFIRPVRSQATLRRQSSTVGMGTIASHYMQMIVTLRLSSPLGPVQIQNCTTRLHSFWRWLRRFDEIVSHVPNKTKCVDDTLLWEVNLHKSFFQAVDWLDLCCHHGITLNPEKFVFGADTVEFAGFEITPESVRPCKKYLNAILNFPKPTNITDIRSWFGLVNQVSYAFAATERMLPFRELLKPGSTFLLNDEVDTFLKNPVSLLAKLRKEYVSLTNRNQHAWPPIGPKMASAFGSSRNTAHALPLNHFAAPPGGKSH